MLKFPYIKYHIYEIFQNFGLFREVEIRHELREILFSYRFRSTVLDPIWSSGKYANQKEYIPLGNKYSIIIITSIYKRVDFKGFTWRRASSLLTRQRKERDEKKGEDECKEEEKERERERERKRERGYTDRINVDRMSENKWRSRYEKSLKDSLLRQIYTIHFGWSSRMSFLKWKENAWKWYFHRNWQNSTLCLYSYLMISNDHAKWNG